MSMKSGIVLDDTPRTGEVTPRSGAAGTAPAGMGWGNMVIVGVVNYMQQRERGKESLRQKCLILLEIYIKC